jgi:hypothetical protein
MNTEIIYKNNTYKDRTDLLYYFISTNNNDLPEKLFPGDYIYYCAAALENKFNTPFSVEDILKIFRDKSWQHKASQIIETKEEKDVSQ